MQFENDKITPQQINEIVKKELTSLRPLFISSQNGKNIKMNLNTDDINELFWW